jgi:hypothetical protein
MNPLNDFCTYHQHRYCVSSVKLAINNFNRWLLSLPWLLLKLLRCQWRWIPTSKLLMIISAFWGSLRCDSPRLKLCYLFIWPELFQLKTPPKEKTVIVELGEFHSSFVVLYLRTTKDQYAIISAVTYYQ